MKKAEVTIKLDPAFAEHLRAALKPEYEVSFGSAKQRVYYLASEPVYEEREDGTTALSFERMRFNGSVLPKSK